MRAHRKTSDSPKSSRYPLTFAAVLILTSAWLLIIRDSPNSESKEPEEVPRRLRRADPAVQLPSSQTSGLRRLAPEVDHGDLPSELYEIGEYSPNFTGDLREPLDYEELTHLAAHPRKDRFRLKILICRAAADKDIRFRYLLTQEGLRDDPWMDIAVAAYDYSVNGNMEALDYILKMHAAEQPGSDSDSVLILSFLDEWQRSIPAVLKHFENGTDGAGGTGYSSFWATRKFLYPQKFARLLRESRAQE